MIVILLDRDGTVETSGGIIPLAAIRKLKNHPDVKVYAYGNPKLVEEADIPYAKRDDGLPGRIGPQPAFKTFQELEQWIAEDKKQRCLWAMRMHPNANMYIAVDDLNIPLPNGWKLVKPEEFATMLTKLLNMKKPNE